MRPTRHRFVYPTYFLMLPLRSLRAAPCEALKRNRFGLITFHDRDHGDGREDSLAWIDDLLDREGIVDAGGEVWLHSYPRVLGCLLIQTSVSGELRPLTASSLRAAFFGMPLMTLGVIVHIHWQALMLWRKHVPFFRKPEPPSNFITR